MHSSSKQSEFELIRRYFADPKLSFQRHGIALGIGDDAALIEVPSAKRLAMSMDVLVADCHFPLHADPYLIANRALAVNLSDLAAMSAEPFCFTLGLVLPHSDEAWLQRFAEGLQPLAQQYNCPLVGGDTCRGPLSISIQVQGLCDKTENSRRSGAKPGDRLYLTGTLGDGAIALLTQGIDSHLGSEFRLKVTQPDAVDTLFFESAYFRPEPRVKLSLAARNIITSCIDISDGLYGDLQHILEASGVGAQVQLDAIPYSNSALRCVDDNSRLRAALYGGDDYELCLTVAAENSAELEGLARELEVQLSYIGDIVSALGAHYLGSDGRAVELGEQAYQHFRGVNPG
jgi:thiamine-monophosphate kinase